MTGSLWLSKAQKFFWALFLVSLPVTSFPYFPSGLGGGTLVRPLALYPLLVLLLIAVLPRLWNRPAPRTLLPFLAFLTAALVGTVFSVLRDIDPVLGVTVLDRVIRNLISLFLGGAFYFAVALIPQTWDDLRFSLRWLYAGFAVALFWGSLQAIYVIKFHPAYFDLLRQFQRFVSIRKLFPTRISGLTYEPNWFAEQIAFLLMPWLFTAVFSRFSVFRWRKGWLTVELILLIWASGVLVFTYSRSGLILLAAQLFLIFLIRSHRSTDSQRKPGSNFRTVGRRLLQAGMALVVLVGIVFVIGSRNNYFSRLWNYWSDEESAGTYLQYIAFDQRFAYWGTAFRIYTDYPLLGVGLGNFTFYFDEYLSDRPLHPTPELLALLTPEAGRSQLVTVKSLFPRLLAETGLLGTACFLAFFIAVLGGVVFLLLTPDDEAQFWGRAGVLGIVVFGLVSFSFDSFSLPNMWVVLGLITAATAVCSQRKL